jgi:hypothetical protein
MRNGIAADRPYLDFCTAIAASLKLQRSLDVRDERDANFGFDVVVTFRRATGSRILA